jgi:flagellar basal-body rod protein FlgC
MNVISSNLANINTTRTPEGGPYQRKDLIFAACPAKRLFEDVLSRRQDTRLSGVKVAGIVNDPREPLLRFDPQHPDANRDGYVAMPNINLIEEMVNMMSAARSYEANVAAINASKKMAGKALEIGR